MIDLLTSPALALLIQSNDLIGQMVGNGGLEPDLEQYVGFLGIIGQFFLLTINAIQNFIGDYGLAIILTAVLVRLMLLPLTIQQVRGMRAMQMLQPVMKEIQKFYPNKQDQSAKTMELYGKYKINPLSGCLPMVIQLPILFGVYRALYDPSFAGKDFLGIQLLFPVNVTSGRSFGLGPELKDIIDVTIHQLGLMPQIVKVPDAVPLIGGGFWYLPALILVVFYVASSFIMQRVMRNVNAPDPDFVEEFKEVMKSRKDKDDKPQEPDMAQQMQKQMGMMNFVIIIFAFIFSAGALLYFIIQNMLMMLEYTLIPKLAAPGPDLDARELRRFIRTAPAPTRQPGAVPASKQPAKPAAGASESTEETSQEDVSREGVEAASSPDGLKRPRKKRRKR